MATVLRPSTYDASATIGAAKYNNSSQLSQRGSSTASCHAQGDGYSPFGLNNYEARKFEAEICHRFVQISCAKMHASRQSRSGARLYENLLILRLLAKARSDAKMLPYECADLLIRRQYLNSRCQQIYEAAGDVEDESPQLSKGDNDLCKKYDAITQNDITSAPEPKSHQLHESATDDFSSKLMNKNAKNEDEDFSITMNDINESINEQQQQEVVEESRGSFTAEMDEASAGNNEMDCGGFSVHFSSVFSSESWKVELKEESMDHGSEAEEDKDVPVRNLQPEENTTRDMSNEMRFFNGRLYERISKVAVLHSNNSGISDMLRDEKKFPDGKFVKKASDNSEIFNAETIEEEDIGIACSSFQSPVKTATISTSLASYNFREWCQSTSASMSLLSSSSSLSSSMLSSFSSSSTNSPESATLNTVNEIPSLHTIMSNPVSPPLKSINNDIFSNFHAAKTVNFDCAELKNSFNYIDNNCYDNYYQTSEMQKAADFLKNNDDYCTCDETSGTAASDADIDVVTAADSAAGRCNCASDNGSFCRKRKTSGNGTMAICEKRYCCDEKEGTDKMQILFEESEETQTDYCNKCGGQKLKPISETAEIDISVPNVDIVTDDENDIYSFGKSSFHNVQSTRNFSGWLMNETQPHQRQQYQQQCYNYQSNSVIYRHTKNNNNIQQQQQVMEQVVPVTRHNHFVGPIVGLVAETPCILMF